MRTVRTTCPLDCFDQCALQVDIDNGRAVSVTADPSQKYTGHFICRKGAGMLERITHPARLLYPLLKRGESFTRISWTAALQEIAEKITTSLDKYGPLALMHFFDGGHGGTLKNIESRFFSALGGGTTHRGSLCWSAGLAAQKYDFGAVKSHPYSDLLNSRLIILWGRNPAATSVHLLPFIRQARSKGARVILIDPVRTATAFFADQHISIKPAADGALALGMANYLIANQLIDQSFINNHSSGFEQFKKMVSGYSTEKVSAITGLKGDQIEMLARDYGEAKPSAIMVGIGLQRHSNGGNTVRAIDALAALTGNIGVPGGGSSYVNFRVSRYIDHAFLSGQDLTPEYRYYPKPQLGRALEEFSDPPIDFLYISRSNPLVQVGDSSRLEKAMSKVSFIVSADHFMTDSAAAADLVLPVTTFLEEEDLFYNSMGHPYINYGPPVIEPPGECRSEYDYLQELAAKLGIEGFPRLEPADLLTRAILPLTAEFGIRVPDIQKGPLLLPEFDELPWNNRVFETADGRYHFYSEQAGLDGCDPLPEYHEPLELNDTALHEAGFKYWFVTPHPRDSIHSTHRLPADGKVPRVFIHSQTALAEGIFADDTVHISSPRGSISAQAVITDLVRPDTVMVYEGWWHSSGAAVNKLTPDRLTDMGNQAAYYDCLCRIDQRK